MITQLYITNWVLLVSLVAADVHLFGNSLDRIKFFGVFYGYWALVSLLSIPFWLLYILWSL